MDDATRTSVSKFLSYLLRHRPDRVGLVLDEAGWVDIDVLLLRCSEHGRKIDREQLEEVVATNSKQRFAISADRRRIRANQGHSVSVELGYARAEPPAVLFHGTVARVLEAIRSEGLSRMNRHHVHLSADEATAIAVGKRRGKPVVLRIDARRMRDDGHEFFLSDNGVWLTDHVPPTYLLD